MNYEGADLLVEEGRQNVVEALHIHLALEMADNLDQAEVDRRNRHAVVGPRIAGWNHTAVVDWEEHYKKAGCYVELHREAVDYFVRRHTAVVGESSEDHHMAFAGRTIDLEGGLSRGAD